MLRTNGPSVPNIVMEAMSIVREDFMDSAPLCVKIYRYCIRLCVAGQAPASNCVAAYGRSPGKMFLNSE